MTVKPFVSVKQIHFLTLKAWVDKRLKYRNINQISKCLADKAICAEFKRQISEKIAKQNFGLTCQVYKSMGSFRIRFCFWASWREISQLSSHAETTSRQCFTSCFSSHTFRKFRASSSRLSKQVCGFRNISIEQDIGLEVKVWCTGRIVHIETSC